MQEDKNTIEKNCEKYYLMVKQPKLMRPELKAIFNTKVEVQMLNLLQTLLVECSGIEEDSVLVKDHNSLSQILTMIA